MGPCPGETGARGAPEKVLRERRGPSLRGPGATTRTCCHADFSAAPQRGGGRDDKDNTAHPALASGWREASRRTRTAPRALAPNGEGRAGYEPASALRPRRRRRGTLTARDADSEDEVHALCPRRRRRGARKTVTTARWAPPPMAKGPKGEHEISRALPSPPTAKGIKKDRYELAPSLPTAGAADEIKNAPRTKTNEFTVARGQDTPFPTPVSRTDKGRRPRGWLLV